MFALTWRSYPSRFVKNKMKFVIPPNLTCLLLRRFDFSRKQASSKHEKLGTSTKREGPFLTCAPFRAEKRNKHARVLAARQAPSLKKWREFCRSGKQKKLRTKYAFSIFPLHHCPPAFRRVNLSEKCAQAGMERDRLSLVENTVPFDIRKFRKFKPEFLVEWNAPH